MSSGPAASVPPDADVKAAREGEAQFHGSGAPLNPDETAATRASEGTGAPDNNASQAASEAKDASQARGSGSSSGSAVNPPGFDATAATDPEGGSFSPAGDTAPGLPSTGSPVQGFSQE
ncbi:hypothetical protein OEZ85_011631 [Tetradesmus obliquus]|uniref:SMP domain-containing protein n=1 Tax=Tetradesmus obliquus TaxID=3088 RepID=A0ABY8TQX7_TETOB|nr:hypothetical protein OEZ85_011631 [Tetradesmus obliquus]